MAALQAARPADRFPINNILWAHSAPGSPWGSESTRSPLRKSRGDRRMYFPSLLRPLPGLRLSVCPAGSAKAPLRRAARAAAAPGKGDCPVPVGLENPVSPLFTPNRFNLCLKKTKPFPHPSEAESTANKSWSWLWEVLCGAQCGSPQFRCCPCVPVFAPASSSQRR